MKREYYQPTDNYERNFLMVKKFGGKISVLAIPILMFISIICSVYMRISGEQSLELNILKVVTTKFNLSVEFTPMQTVGFIISILLFAFFIYSILYIFFMSKNSSFYASPDLGLMLLHKFSVCELISCVLAFVAMVVTTAVFIFSEVSRFESLGELFNLTLVELEAYKPTIVVIFIVIDVLLFLAIWYAQSQTDFLKSIRQTLVESLPKNKGAHKYGVFSMALGIAFLCIAGFCTFMYYCYRDAFSGFGINLDETYAFISLINSYVKGLIPLCIALSAFTFSTMVDESNTMGTLYNNYAVLGDASDPNMIR